MRKIWVVLVVMVVLGVGTATGVSAAQPAATGPIKIGLMGNLSAPFSLSAKAAAMLAVEEMNNAGGILGRKVELIIEDTKGEIPKCVELYKKLVVTDRVLAVVIAEKVEMGVAGMEIGAELFPEYPHIFFSTIGSGDDIWHHVRDNYKKYRFGFQTYYLTSTGYLTILTTQNEDIYKNIVKARKLAIVYEDMDWTRILKRGIPNVSPPLPDVHKKKGFQIAHETTVSLDQKMFSPVFENIAKAQVDVIECVIGYIDEAAFVKQWAMSGARNIPLMIYGGLAGMPAAWKATEGKVNGVMVGSSLVRVPITKRTIPFMDNLVNKYKIGPIFGSHTTYDTLYGFKKAIEQAGGTGNIDKLIAQLEKVEEVAVLGTIGWDKRYHYNLPYPKYVTPIVQWQKGEMQVIYPLKYKTANYVPPADLRK